MVDQSKIYVQYQPPQGAGAIPSGAPTWRPRMIGDPAPVVNTGPTPSQLAFRKALAAGTAPVPRPPLPPQQPQSPAYVYTPQGNSFDASGGGRGSQQQPFGMQVKNSAGQWVRIGAGSYSPVRYPGQADAPALNWGQIADEYGHPGIWSDPTRNPNYVAPTVKAPATGAVTRHPYMAKGGVIPEPAGDHNPNYTTSRSYGGGPVRYDPTQDKEYWAPAKRKGNKASGKSGTKRTSTASGGERGKNKPAPTRAASPTRPDGWQGATSSDTSPQRPGDMGWQGATSGGHTIGADQGFIGDPTPVPPPQVVAPRRSLTSDALDTVAGVLGGAGVAQAQPGFIATQGEPQGAIPSNAPSVQPSAPVRQIVQPTVPGVAHTVGHEGAIVGTEPQPTGAWINGQFVPMYTGYARGGTVEPAGDHNPNYTSSASYSAPGESDAPQTDNVRPTPMLLDHVSQALDGGVKFLTQHFGLNGGGGAMPTPADPAQAQVGAQRFAQGEGAATPQEIQGVDDHVDPQRRLSEGDRQMTRLAKMTQWYLQQGRPKDAQASAASLMQYGAGRFSKLGTLAAASYQEYLQTRDPTCLQHTADYLKGAYQMIPDGSGLDVKLDPKRHVLVATHTGPDGSESNFEVTPEQLPGLIRGVMDKSSYWQQIFQMADPVGYRQQAGWAHQAATTADARAYQERSKLAGETRAEARARAREERQAARADARSAAADARAKAGRDASSARYDMDMTKVGPARAAADQALAAINADNAPDPSTPEGQTLQTTLDQAASRLYDALPPGRNKDQYMREAGYDPGTWHYATATAAAPAAPGGDALTANLYKGDVPPEKFPDAKRAKDGTWWVIPADGSKPKAVGAP